METKQEKTLGDLVRMTEVVTGGHKDLTAVQEFSILNSLKTKEYLRDLNAGNLESKIYQEVCQTRLENIEFRCWYDNGFIEGLRFNWSNGIST